uniref:Secreted protein n=1 Tax=Acrobeloides nanus TaxID=290746 RepID=A0A914C3K3_9BILA
MQFFMWLIFGSFIIVLLCCSSLVACYACRAIRSSFRHAVGTEGDIIFQNPRGVIAMPHPGSKYAHNYDPPYSKSDHFSDNRRDHF